MTHKCPYYNDDCPKCMTTKLSPTKKEIEYRIKDLQDRVFDRSCSEMFRDEALKKLNFLEQFYDAMYGN